MEFNPKDIVNEFYSNLEVKEYVGTELLKGGLRYFYRCECKCGNFVKVERQNLIQKHTKSCGCLKKLRGKSNKDWKGYEELPGRHWGHIKKHAESRGITFNIIIKDAWDVFIKQQRICAISGVEISFNSSKKDNYKQSASLDRIDSSKGYEFDNIQWVHKKVNLMKMAMSEDEFLNWCRLIVNHRGIK